MENQLEAEDLGETLTGVLAGDADDVATRAWRKSQAKAKDIIRKTVDISLVDRVLSHTSVRELLAALEREFGMRKGIAGAQLEREIYSMKLEEGGSLREHLHKFDKYVKRLQSVEIHAFPAGKKTSTFLMSLPVSMGFWVGDRIHRIARGETYSWEDLLKDLTAHETTHGDTVGKIKKKKVEIEENNINNNYLGEEDVRALATEREERPSLICFYCNKSGHCKAECLQYIASHTAWNP